jgi:uncharacterized protein
MSDEPSPASSFLGTGWSFPPEFRKPGRRPGATGGGSGAGEGYLVMTSDEADIEASLRILFTTEASERFLNPKYGLGMREILFDSLNTTSQTFLKDRIRTAILIYEPRIHLVSLELDTSREASGEVGILVEYVIRATNSRYNLVFPFYRSDANERRATVEGGTSPVPGAPLG